MNLVPSFEIASPKTADEAVALKASKEATRFLGGGTDLLPNLRRGLGEPELLIRLDAIEETKTFGEKDGHLVIGASVTVSTVEHSDLIRKSYPALAEAAATIAGPGHRAAATVGGNLCLDTRCVFYNQSEWWRKANGYCMKRMGTVCHVAPTGNRCHAAFSGDLAPAFIALGAEVEIASPKGRRRVPLAKIYKDDGRAHLALDPAELLVAVHVPATKGVRSGYLKSRIRRAMDFPLAGVAVALTRKGDVIESLRVALTGTDSYPVALDVEKLAGSTPEAAMEGVRKQIMRTIKPMRTTLTPGHYRRHVAIVLANRLIAKLYESA